jgi:hypothetical protein
VSRDKWEQHFAERVPDDDMRQRMWEFWVGKRYPKEWYGGATTAPRAFSKSRVERLKKDPEWRQWADYVLSIPIEIEPNARAVMYKPSFGPGEREAFLEHYGPAELEKHEKQFPPETHLRVEVQWKLVKAGFETLENGARQTLWDYAPVSAHIYPRHSDVIEPRLAWGESPDLDAYFMACRVELAARKPGRRKRLPRVRPKPGVAKDLGFYRQILDEYERLLSKGHKRPAQEIARSMSENPSTVKTWLRRGRKYLQED